MLDIHLHPHAFITEEQTVEAWESSINRNALLEMGEQWIGKKFHLLYAMYRTYTSLHHVIFCSVLQCHIDLLYLCTFM